MTNSVKGMRNLLAALVLFACSPAIAAETLVACTASWCGPCQRFHRDLKADPSLPCGRAVRLVDVDRDSREARRLGVRSMPTFIVFEDGREVRRTSGYSDAAAFKRWLNGR